ncbi:DUF1822 family protein [Myxacorys almedinensis]|uniref:DUF1822 family protein n=1 Tax=Myxacorys almedinensis A TaxID=2690445 RepID=A0A8J7YZ06_9CYAN|nr:DUF1822 family protein [Myxacorys almedinensis]NDJ17144.1 DUF1822 family protein [Myxacorys almedinensis A]
MSVDQSNTMSTPSQPDPAQMPQPGEIWEVSPRLRSPIPLSREEQQRLYAEPAYRFLQGGSARYVMIVTAPKSELDEADEPWQAASVMVLSVETQFLSDVDILIPRRFSGLGQDLLAETWHVQEMLICNLLRAVGYRLSRLIYDGLMTVGDYAHGVVEAPPPDLDLLGLHAGTTSAQNDPTIQRFHDHEVAWSDVLTVPVAAQRSQQKRLQLTHALLNEAIHLERELASDRVPIALSQWLQKTVKAGLPSLLAGWKAEMAGLAMLYGAEPIATRSLPVDPLPSGNSDAIQALVDLIQTAQDDETLWSAVESLWNVAPDHTAAGVRHVKLVDLGMQIAGQAIALAVAIVQKANGQVGVLLQVYPTRPEAFLPPNLTLLLLDESGRSLREIVARQADICLQLKLSGEPGEEFSVRVTLGEASITEHFVI